MNPEETAPDRKSCDQSATSGDIDDIRLRLRTDALDLLVSAICGHVLYYGVFPTSSSFICWIFVAGKSEQARVLRVKTHAGALTRGHSTKNKLGGSRGGSEGIIKRILNNELA